MNISKDIKHPFIFFGAFQLSHDIIMAHCSAALGGTFLTECYRLVIEAVPWLWLLLLAVEWLLGQWEGTCDWYMCDWYMCDWCVHVCACSSGRPCCHWLMGLWEQFRQGMVHMFVM